MTRAAPPALVVTGATGFLGRTLVARAHESGRFRVLGTVHRSAPPEGAEWEAIPLDLCREEAAERILGNLSPSVVVHAAYGKEPDALHPVIVEGTRAVVRACKKSGALLLHLSTDLVFGGGRGRYRETDLPDPVLPYGEAKLEAERIALHHERTIVVRPSLLYDPLEPAPCEEFVLRALARERRPKLHTWEKRSPTFREDLVAALLVLAETGNPSLLGKDEGGRVLHAGGATDLDRHAFAVALAPFRSYDAELLDRDEAPREGDPRPADCTLVSDRLQSVTGIRLRGVPEVVALPRIPPRD
jgi:dTDP-4-dehydrorhamnose reductase